MVVGHISRALESAGVPTVTIYVAAFRRAATVMHVSRAVVTPFPMGRPLGPPHAAGLQRRLSHDALTLLETAAAPGAVVDLPYAWEPADGGPASTRREPTQMP